MTLPACFPVANVAVPPGWKGVVNGKSADDVVTEVLVFCDCIVFWITFLTAG